MAYTTVSPVAVGARIKAAWANLLVGAIQELQAAAVGLGTDKRPQVRVYAPASVTLGNNVPYASTRKDTHGGWNGTLYQYTVPVSGLYLANIAYKCSGTASTPSQFLRRSDGTSLLSGPNSASGLYLGGALSGTVDLAAGEIVSVREQGASYTPQNDATGGPGTGSNYFHLTYLGPTT